tara:strand:- start:95 stop:895 length:801 start_codon:yes stop_codon:yes gene_type:complete
MNLNNKTFIITGASSGIGKSLALSLSKKNANVVLASRQETKLNIICNEITSSGGSASVVVTDITIKNDCDNLVKSVKKKYGNIDGLILNAGISMWAPFEEITDISFFNQLINVNYMGAVYCVNASLPSLKRSNGVIVSCSTAQSIIGFNNHSGYVASKHALHGFLDTIQMESKGEIKSLEIILGWIKGTNLRENAFGPSGRKLGQNKKKHSKNSVDLNYCVSQIIKGIENEKKTLYIPKKLCFIPFLDLFFPNYIRKKIMKAVMSE